MKAYRSNTIEISLYRANIPLNLLKGLFAFMWNDLHSTYWYEKKKA